ncbi:hypothetical protein ABTF08_21400, partial [Acinetobacter baumannii]
VRANQLSQCKPGRVVAGTGFCLEFVHIPIPWCPVALPAERRGRSGGHLPKVALPMAGIIQ